MILKLVLLGLAITSRTSRADDVNVSGKVVFPSEDSNSSGEDATPKKVAVAPATIVKNYVAVNVQGIIQPLSSINDNLRAKSVIQQQSSDNQAITIPNAICQKDGNCKLILDPSYNQSDSDINTITVPIVPIYKGLKRVSTDGNPSVGSFGDFSTTKPDSNLIPNYDFRVVPIVLGLKGVQTTSKPFYHYIPTVSFPTKKTFSGVVYNGPRYPYAYQNHFQQNYRPNRYNHVSPGTANNHRNWLPNNYNNNNNNNNNQGWVRLIPSNIGSHTKPKVQGYPSITRCHVITVNRNIGTVPSVRKPDIAVDGKVHFPKVDIKENLEISNIEIDGKVGIM